MIDPAPLAHEPSDVRPVALLDLPAEHPQQQWEQFTRHLDRPTTPTTASLQRWLGGRPVLATHLLTRRHGDRQYRVVSLVTTFDGEQVPLCHAAAVVELQLLPGWVRDVLTRTDRSLARTLHDAGAVRDRTTATALQPDPDAPGDAGLHTTGTFSLPGAGGRRAVATVEEYFTGYVLELAATAGPHHPAEPDAALVRLLHQRSVLTPDGAAPPRQSEQLVHLHRRSRGEQPDPAAGSADENAADRRGA